ncbi:MAG: hypothetical protein KatS3mg108_3558 [Isosphaeraceae bacterium]|jgi:hypothetical protein|nr:MAG: hypothetical protein KatS3mg108_3558 [Isosphaeraceae bacterium]
METSLHRQLKQHYAGGPAGRCEVTIGGLRVDAISPDGQLIEVQSGPLGPLKSKLTRLLASGHRVRVVKPVVLTRRIVRLQSPQGPILDTRRSPWRGALLNVFDDLPGLAGLMRRSPACLEILGVAIDEHRVARRRWPGYRVLDRVLVDVLTARTVECPDDLWSLLAVNLPDPFTTRDLAAALGRPLGFAQRVAYSLRESGASRLVGKRHNLRLYSRQPARRSLRGSSWTACRG